MMQLQYFLKKSCYCLISYFILALFLSLSSAAVNAQQVRFDQDIKVEYSGVMKLGEKYKVTEKFILLANSDQYYFAAEQNFENDTGLYDVEANPRSTRGISYYFPERVIKSKKYYTFLSVTDSKIKREENPELQWVLYGDKKKINGVECQLATTNKYGRRWYAYFASSYPFSAGPYKFSGLPGLIFELYDRRDEYHFTLTSISKIKGKFAFNLSAYKTYPLKNYLQAKNNLLFTSAIFPEADAEMKKYIDGLLEKKKKMYNNPLELDPYK